LINPDPRALAFVAKRTPTRFNEITRRYVGPTNAWESAQAFPIVNPF
jgi:hypothetical protein